MRARAIILWAVGAILGVGMSVLVLSMLMGAEKRVGDDFAASVDLTPLDKSALFNRGRLKSFDSFAHEMVRMIGGRDGIPGPGTHDERTSLPADYAYLDVMIRPEEYASRDMIPVRNTLMRFQLAETLKNAGRVTDEWAQSFVKHGQVSTKLLLGSPEVASLMDRWARDVMRTAKFQNEIEIAVALSQQQQLSNMLMIVPPPTRDPKTPWLGVNDIFEPAPGVALTERAALAKAIAPETLAAMRIHWTGFIQAWRDRDAPAANAHLASFCEVLPGIAPNLYPDTARLGWESFYFRAKFLVWDWLIYLVAVIFLLMSVAFRWPGARSLGLGVFSVALAIQTGSIALRWYVSGRWPNSNMFEAVTTSVWMGTVVAVALEIMARKTPLRNLFAITAGVASMAAMMSGQFIEKLDPSINNMMPILHDLWLYIHTNTVIASYALIAMASVTALLYLVRRGALVIRRRPGRTDEYAKVGGTGMLLVGGAEAPPGSDGTPRTSMGEVLDGATLVLMELSFIMLWSGLVMGAIWADHSWGRPWGWDPKEVFALNTFIVFAILIHVRLKVRDKGLWTALLAVAGCGVMLFNWIIINFVIAGLHSYA